jgi:predicted TIM-barrel fold metal-dependent hydrolase
MHIFTVDHVPNKFLPFGLTSLMKVPWLRTPLRLVLTKLNPFSNRDLFQRYSNFIKISTNKTQEDVFKVARSYYPLDTKFVVLPMDMAYMDAGDVPEDINEQHAKLYQLSTHPQYGKQIIPFAAIDPRREGVLGIMKELVEEKGFKGVKLYPPLGYSPDHDNLHPVYEYAEDKGIPVMTHCSRGGVRNKKISKEQAAAFTDPDNYKAIMEKYPNLRICMGHCGGDEDWQRYLNDPWDENSSATSKSWLSKILDIMRSGEFPNLYADVSYTIFKIEEHSQILKVLLQDDKVKTQILFGSDFYMVEQEEFLERRLAMSLRATLGEDLFTQIAETNPRQYLGNIQNP